MSETKSFRLPNILSLLAAIGIALSFISLFHHTAANNGFDLGKSAYCNISESVNCDAVNLSPYSYLLGVPVASYGLWFYGALMLFSFLIRGGALITRETAIAVSLIFSAVAVVVSVVLFIISEAVIHVLCPVCAGMYGVNVLMFIASLVAARGAPITGQCSAGVRALLRAPRALVSTSAPEVSRAAYLVTAFLVLLAYGCVTLPDVLLVRILLPEAVSKNEDAAATAAISEWQAAPQVSIPVTTEGSAAALDYSVGPASAPIQLVEFSDFECPYCRQLYGDLESLIARNPGKVRFVFRNFPLDNSCNPEIPKDFHHNACEAAIFARCAGEQGKFWEAIGYLFTLEEFDQHAGKERISQGISRGLDALSLDRQAMDECVKSDRPREKITADIKDAAAAGIQGTPFVVLNGKVVKTPTPKVLAALFDLILKR